LIVTFCWQNDRFVHRISLVEHSSSGSGTVVPRRCELADSAQDLGESPWPLNPPLQQLDECQMAGQRRGLVGLGMAGTSHWSLAVESRGRQLWFDVACRVYQPPGRLQSCYDLAEPARAISSTGDAIELCNERPEAPVRVELRADTDTTRMLLDDTHHRVCLFPHEPTGSWPVTVRWRYGFAVTA
jgi:hypothetical protein